eukprot:gene7773-959_t
MALDFLANVERAQRTASPAASLGSPSAPYPGVASASAGSEYSPLRETSSPVSPEGFAFARPHSRASLLSRGSNSPSTSFSPRPPSSSLPIIRPQDAPQPFGTDEFSTKKLPCGAQPASFQGAEVQQGRGDSGSMSRARSPSMTDVCAKKVPGPPIISNVSLDFLSSPKRERFNSRACVSTQPSALSWTAGFSPQIASLPHYHSRASPKPLTRQKSDSFLSASQLVEKHAQKQHIQAYSSWKEEIKQYEDSKDKHNKEIDVQYGRQLSSFLADRAKSSLQGYKQKKAKEMERARQLREGKLSAGFHCGKRY